MSTKNMKTTSIMCEEADLMDKTAAQKASNPTSIRNISSNELVREIHIGWNLGNTMDATGGYGISSETSWGNPKTNKAMIDKIKAGGFNTLNLKQRADWANFYVKSARAKGIPCIWWDNGAVNGSGELFGLLDRTNDTFYYPDIVNAMMRGIQ